MIPLGGQDNWNGNVAYNELVSWAGGKDNLDFDKFKKGFMFCNLSKGNVLGACKLPYCNVVDGKLIANPKAIEVIGSVLSGSRGGVKIPEEDKKQIKSKVEHYYKLMKKEVPWKDKKEEFEDDIPEGESYNDVEFEDMNDEIELVYDKGNPPERIKGLPNHAKDIWVSAFNSAFKNNSGNEEVSNKIAWAAVKKAGYSKDGEGKWIKNCDKVLSVVLDVPINLSEYRNTRLQLAREGIFNHKIYGKLEFNEAVFDEMVNNFDNDVYNAETTEGLPIDTEHQSQNGAYAWIRKLYTDKMENGKLGLFAVVDWTPQGIDVVENRLYKFMSITFLKDFTNAETGEKFKNVVIGAALTVRPFIRGMESVELCEMEEIMEKDVKEVSNEMLDKIAKLEQGMELAEQLKVEKKELAEQIEREKIEKIEMVEKVKKLEDQMRKMTEDREREVKELKFKEIEKDSKLLVDSMGLKMDLIEDAQKMLSNLVKMEQGLVQLSELQGQKMSEIFVNVMKASTTGLVQLGSIGHGKDMEEKEVEKILEKKEKENFADIAMNRSQFDEMIKLREMRGDFAKAMGFAIKEEEIEKQDLADEVDRLRKKNPELSYKDALEKIMEKKKKAKQKKEAGEE